MRRPIRSSMVAVVVGLGLAPGCSTTGSGSSVEQYNSITGALSTTLEVPLTRAYAAAVGAVTDLEFKVEDDKKDALQGVVRATRANGGSVRIDLDRKGDALTEVTVRVGALGNESVARAVLERIRARVR